MREHSKEAWNVAYRYSALLASETRDLAAHIDVALAAERERCAVLAERYGSCEGHVIGPMIRRGDGE